MKAKRLHPSPLREDLTATLLYGVDALTALKTIPSNSVDVTCTSPPYFQLIDYLVKGQLGHEEIPQEYILNVAEICRELFRVQKPTGSLWWNIADCFAKKNFPDGIKKGELIGIPWMSAFAIREQGFYLRSENIWNKRDPISEGRIRRTTRAHEQVFMFTKTLDYFFDWFAIAEAVENPGKVRPFRDAGEYKDSTMRQDNGRLYIPLSIRNKRSVWSISTGRFAGVHFATFPIELVSLMIKAGSGKDCCKKCGAPRERIVEDILSGTGNSRLRRPTSRGWKAMCDCDAGFRPCVVLDPFSGSGTSGEAAISLGRSYIGIDISAEYRQMAEDRIMGRKVTKTPSAKEIARSEFDVTDFFETTDG